MNKYQYIKIGLIILVFALVNLVPLNIAFLSGGEEEPSDIQMEIYPNPPQNMSFLNTDTTVTLLIKNRGANPEEIEYDITEKSENLFINGRDGIKLPDQKVLNGEENYYQSFALIPLNPFQGQCNLEFTVTSQNDNVVISENFSLRISKPEMSPSDLESIVVEKGQSPSSKFFLVPRYRRYWHPELNEVGEASIEYVWIAVSGENNLVIDDESGELITQNIELPWKISEASEIGPARIWNGSEFVNKKIPSPNIRGDNSYNQERFELYFASGKNHAAWVTRRVLYWTSENLVKGGQDEIPDTERVELWVSAENGEELFTISDYHHYAFRYDAVESYTIQTFWHCPLPSDSPLIWTVFTLTDYKNVYPSSSIKHDHLGFSEKIHPIDRALEEKMPLIKRNLIGVGLTALILIIPYSWNNWIKNNP